MLGAIAMASVLWVGGHMLSHGSLTIGTLVSSVFLLNLVFQPLQELSDLYGQVQSAGAAMEKITIVLDESPRSTTSRSRSARLASTATCASTRSRSPTGATPCCTPSTSTCRAGGCLALVGESGGGKSTTAKLVGRFYDPDGGAIRVDGRDLRELELRSYRRQLGVVLQDPFLFAGTIADNIRFAHPEATDEEVADVAHAVGVDRIARRFESGLLHEVREGGAGLSAGERQLISIARALLADPRILILDEATSNIDRPTEILIEKALDRLLRGRTSIIIAHRLATVRRADEILVMEHGRITQRGTIRRAARRRRAVPTARFRAERRRASAAGGLAVGAGDRQPGEQLGERRELRARVAAEEELVDAAQVRLRGLAQLRAPSSVSFA